MTKEKRLGRGLAALLGDSSDMVSVAEVERTEAGGDDRQGHPSIVLLDVDDIHENPFQPRREFNEPEIASLAESLKEHDMLQPILVRASDSGWELISGERRFRAAMRAGWRRVPAQVREADDRLVAELAIVENLQRKDLSPLEKALSFPTVPRPASVSPGRIGAAFEDRFDRRLLISCGLLELPPEVQDDLTAGRISVGPCPCAVAIGGRVGTDLLFPEDSGGGDECTDGRKCGARTDPTGRCRSGCTGGIAATIVTCQCKECSPAVNRGEDEGGTWHQGRHSGHGTGEGQVYDPFQQQHRIRAIAYADHGARSVASAGRLANVFAARAS